MARCGAPLVKMQLGVSELRRAVDSDKKIEPPLPGLHLGDVHEDVFEDLADLLFNSRRMNVVGVSIRAVDC